MKNKYKKHQIKLMSDGLYKENISKKRLQNIIWHFYLLGKKDGITACELAVLRPK